MKGTPRLQRPFSPPLLAAGLACVLIGANEAVAQSRAEETPAAILAARPLAATAASSGLCGASGNRFGFGGYIYDCELGLYYTPAGRMYSPEVGRFLQQDSYLGDILNPPSLHRYTFAHNNPTSFVDPTGHESYRQWLGLDRPTPDFWTEFGKNVAYRSFNFVSLGTLGRQDTLVEQYERGQIGEGGYWLKTGANAATAGAAVVAATATGGVASGFAGGLGASATTSAIVGGATAGFTAQATSDVSEVAVLGTKSLDEVSAADCVTATSLGAVTAGALGQAGSRGADLNPSLHSFRVDNPITATLASGLEATGRYAYQGGASAARAMIVVEGGSGPVLVPVTSDTSGAPTAAAAATTRIQTTVGNLRRAELRDAHHVIQDALKWTPFSGPRA